MEKTNMLEAIKSDSKLRGLFFLRMLDYLSIEMRNLLAAEEIPREAIRRINEINHKLYPAVWDVVLCPESSMPSCDEWLLSMLEKVGLSDLMETSLSESQRLMNEPVSAALRPT